MSKDAQEKENLSHLKQLKKGLEDEQMRLSNGEKMTADVAHVLSKEKLNKVLLQGEKNKYVLKQ